MHPRCWGDAAQIHFQFVFAIQFSNVKRNLCPCLQPSSRTQNRRVDSFAFGDSNRGNGFAVFENQLVVTRR